MSDSRIPFGKSLDFSSKKTSEKLSTSNGLRKLQFKVAHILLINTLINFTRKSLNSFFQSKNEFKRLVLLKAEQIL